MPVASDAAKDITTAMQIEQNLASYGTRMLDQFGWHASECQCLHSATRRNWNRAHLSVEVSSLFSERVGSSSRSSLLPHFTERTYIGIFESHARPPGLAADTV